MDHVAFKLDELRFGIGLEKHHKRLAHRLQRTALAEKENGEQEPEVDSDSPLGNDSRHGIGSLVRCAGRFS